MRASEKEAFMEETRLGARVLPAIVALLCAAAPAGAVTHEEFRLRTGADLVALCSTPSEDPLYVAAIHFCHGFGTGTYQTIRALTSHEKLEPVFCPPDPPPSRNEGLARFLEWAKANPGRLNQPPADVLGRFLVEKYPCRK
jgi:hypothetical protein